MHCPKCSAKGACHDSREMKDHTVSRRYNCPRCKWRWSTTEQIVFQGRKLKAARGPVSLAGMLNAKHRKTGERKVLKELLTRTYE